MKKAALALLAFCLVAPAIAHAGSATSRWDMTIGGFVKFDMGWATQAQNQDINLASRSSGANDNLADKYGNFYSYAGETRLNFLVRGPDAWGAKTMAFVEGDFRGNQANGSSSSNAGTFSLRHAYMGFEWKVSKLIIGHTYQKWGYLPTYANTILGYNDIAPFLKGQRQPMIRFEQWYPNSINWSFAIMSPTNTLGSGSSSLASGTNISGNGDTVSSGVDGYTMSQMPFFEGSLGWSSDKCGNIGPWKMLFALEGFYGQQKMINQVSTSGILTYSDKNVTSWGAAFKGFVPIIPEKKGNKSGALSVSGVVFYTQNPGWFQASSNSSTNNASFGYNSNNYSTVIQGALTPGAISVIDYAAPTMYGGWGQASYWITDKLYVNGWYGYVRSNVSQAWMNASANTNAMVNTTQIIGNLSYDVNAAVRFGIEYAYYNTRYAGYSMGTGALAGIPLTQKDGSAQSFRVGAWYFF